MMAAPFVIVPVLKANFGPSRLGSVTTDDSDIDNLWSDAEAISVTEIG
jgi:hypothetical protein